MAKEDNGAAETGAPAVSPIADVAATAAEAKTEKDLVDLPQTPETNRQLRALQSDIKVPSDLSKVSPAKAKELAEAGLVEDSDLPGKMYRRKYDGFHARIPDYTFSAYHKELQDEWEEIVLPTADKPAE